MKILKDMKSKINLDLSRRSLLKWGAAATVLSTGLTACGSDNGETVVAGMGGIEDNSADPILTGGKWVTIPCTGCSKFRCVNRAYVVDGVVIRQKTQDDHLHSTDYPTFRSCIRGRGTRWSYLSPDRLKYPMKRKNWTAGNPGNNVAGMKTPHLRGKDEWERISWEDAAAIITSEFKRICENYGTRWIPGDSNLTTNPNGTYGTALPILNMCYTVGMEPKFLNYLGYGTMPMYGENSTGGFPVVRAKIEGAHFGIAAGRSVTRPFTDVPGAVQSNGVQGGLSADRFDVIDKAKVIVQWGQNHAWSQFGSAQLTWRAAKERGAKVYCVDSWLPNGNSAWVDEWIPVRPGTDAALLLAIAHVLISENLYNEDFLNNCTVGFDKDHMPMYDQNGNEIMEQLRTVDGNGVITFTPSSVVVDRSTEPDPEAPNPNSAGKINKYWKLNFRDYVMGTYDGTAKTPAWASAICGTPADKITEMARAIGDIAKNGNPSEELVFTTNQAPGRHANGATMVQTFLTVSWMLGGPIGSTLGGGGSSGMYGGFSAGSNTYFGNLGAGLTKRSVYTNGHDMTVNGPDAWSKKGNPKSAEAYGGMGRPDYIVECNYDKTLHYGVAFAEVPDAVKSNKYHHFMQGQRNCDIRGMIKLYNGNQSNQNVNTKGYIEAHRDPKIEFVMVSDIYFSTEARYADIILPSSTYWEVDGHYNFYNPEMYIGNAHRIIDPIFESKSDYDMEELFMKTLGADPVTAKRYGQAWALYNRENVLNSFLDTSVKLPNGKFEYLLRFDGDDLNEIGVDASIAEIPKLAEGVIPYKQFKEQGFYQVRVTPDQRQKRAQGLVDFLDEVPTFVTNAATGEANHWKKVNPISTETGFYEIFSMNLANYYKIFWHDAPELGPNGTNTGYDPVAIGKLSTDLTNPSQLLYPIAVYRKQPDGYEASRDGATYFNGTVVRTGEFPIQYIAIHPFHRGHSTRTDSKQILELFSDVLFINPETAAQHNVAHGDTVILTSSMGGKIVRRVAVMDTIIPGVVVSTEGGTVRHLDDEATTEAVDWANVIDYGGSANVLTASFRVGQAHQAYNTVIVKMEKVNGELMPQYRWEPDLPDKDRTVTANYYKMI